MKRAGLALALSLAGCTQDRAPRADAELAQLRAALQVSDGERLVAESLLIGAQDPGLALALARAGHTRHPDARARTALRVALDLLYEQRTLAHGAELLCAEFGEHGVVAADIGGGAHWHDPTGSSRAILASETRPIRAMVASPSRRFLVTFTGDPWTGTKLFDLQEDRAVATLVGATSAVFSTDGERLAVTGAGGSVSVLATRTGRELFELPLGGRARAVAFRSDGQQLLAVSDDKKGTVFELAGGRAVHTFELPVRPECAAWAPGANLFIGGSGVGLVYAPGAPAPMHTLPAGAPRVLAGEFAADGKLVLLHVSDGPAPHARRVLGFDLDTGTIRFALEPPAHALAIAPDRERFAIASEAEALVFELASGRLLATMHGHRQPIVTLAFDAEGARLVTAARDATVRVWNLRSGGERRTLSGHEGAIAALAVSPDGNCLATASRDGTVRLWDIARAEWLATLRGHEAGVTSVAFTPDGLQLASGDEHGELRVWDVERGIEVLACDAHTDAITRVAFAPDGKLVLSASGDATAKLWHVADLKLAHQLAGHQGAVLDAAFAASGRFVATASSDRTARAFDARTGAVLQTFTGHRDVVHRIAWRPNRGDVVTCSYDRRVRVFDVGSGACRSILDAGGIPAALACTSDGMSALCASDHGVVVELDAGTSATLCSDPAASHALALLPGTSRFATAGDNGVQIWTRTGETWLTLAERRTATLLACTDNGGWLIVGFADGTATIWPTDVVAAAAAAAPRELDAEELRRFHLPAASHSATDRARSW